MLSFGSAAYRADGQLIDTFSANLETLPGASGDPRTMEWWRGQPDAWENARRDPQDPADVMPRYVAWIKQLPGKPVFVAYPAGFDFMWVVYYLMRFTGENPFSHSALDIKSYAMAMMKSDFWQTYKKTMPRHWFDRFPHTHKALDDAIEQGALFCNMLRESRRV